MNPIHDDSSVINIPRMQVDYLAYEWNEEDIWRSWMNVRRQTNEIQNGARLENAAWRYWWKQLKRLHTVAPETVNWMKDADVTWLYGPLYTGVERGSPLKSQPVSVKLGSSSHAWTHGRLNVPFSASKGTTDACSHRPNPHSKPSSKKKISINTYVEQWISVKKPKMNISSLREMGTVEKGGSIRGGGATYEGDDEGSGTDDGPTPKIPSHTPNVMVVPAPPTLLKMVGSWTESFQTNGGPGRSPARNGVKRPRELQITNEERKSQVSGLSDDLHLVELVHVPLFRSNSISGTDEECEEYGYVAEDEEEEENDLEEIGQRHRPPTISGGIKFSVTASPTPATGSIAIEVNEPKDPTGVIDLNNTSSTETDTLYSEPWSSSTTDYGDFYTRLALSEESDNALTRIHPLSGLS